MVGYLEDAPSSACMADEVKGIRIGKIDDRNRFGDGVSGGIVVGVIIAALSPCEGVREFLERGKVLVLEVDRVGLEVFGGL